MDAFLAVLGVLVLAGVAIVLVRRQARGRGPAGRVAPAEQSPGAAEAMPPVTQADGAGESPMPAGAYDVWRGELNLLNPARNRLDASIAELCRRFIRSDPAARASMRASLGEDDFYTLLAFGKRAAVFGMREPGSGHLVDGLGAIAAMDSGRMDSRDILVTLSLLYHAAARSGQDPDLLFRDAAALAEPRLARLIKGFAKRSPEQRDLRTAWGREEVETEDGPGFVGWEFQEFDPTCDLERASIQIARLFEADQYQPDDVILASELPRIWLAGAGDPSLDETLRAVRAAVSISASLRPTAHPEHQWQQLTAFVVELADEARARALLEMSKKVPEEDFSVLGVAAGRLFCLVVARSFVRGKESYETSRSLARFGSGIAEILSRHAARS